MLFENDTNSINDKIKYICKLIFEVLKIPTYFLDNNNEIIYSLSYENAINPILPDKKEFFIALFKDCSAYDFPIIKSTKYDEIYFAVNLIKDDVFLGSFVIGPSTCSPITAETINKIILENNIPLNLKKDLINYYNSIQSIDYSRLISASLLLYYSIYNKELDPSIVKEKNTSLENVISKIENDSRNILSQNRQNFFFHHSQKREKNIVDSIRQGNKQKLLEQLSLPPDGEFGVLSDNPLRNKKNLLICLVTIATRAAIDGGLDSEFAYSLSDSYIQNVEHLSELNSLNNLENQMFCDFADNVLKAKKNKYAKPIVSCQNYISNHLYQDISLSELAEFVGLNSKYLSSLFHKEVGLTLTQYINSKKIEEAKHLFLSTNHSILDISEWLGFHDQSHFTKIFKKFTGVTPKKFKDGNF
ncbi:helix-turn-helix domain-containing protein [Clostridium sp. C2-6-12]|uniref:helix-turn-helix domain-containing protein n=1 Tax=Clostridium sp. C2-6-12 TaxID=2698832 RepID=UPI001368F532|nr:helix-turn-helix domain-containing protein [Clostridium sp. C2-6-12]